MNVYARKVSPTSKVWKEEVMNEPAALTADVVESFLADLHIAATSLIGSGLEGRANDILWDALMRLQNVEEDSINGTYRRDTYQSPDDGDDRVWDFVRPDGNEFTGPITG